MLGRGSVDWGEEIRRLRRSKVLKQVALAEHLGVDQSTVSRWERGTSIPELSMQRRLIDLVRRPISDEFLLKHSVTVSPSTVVLSNSERVMQAVSLGYSRVHGLPQDQMPGRSNRGKFGSGLEAVIDSIRDRGFYRGDVASISFVCRAPSLSGHRPPVPIRIVWSPVRVGDEYFLRGDRVELMEADFDRGVEVNGGPLRFVMMDEIAR